MSGNRVVRRHRVEATDAGGRTVVSHLAMFDTVVGDQIVVLDEYIDSKQSESLATIPAATVGAAHADRAS